MLAMRVNNGSMIMDIPNLNDGARLSPKLELLRLVVVVRLLEPPLVMELERVRVVVGIPALFRRRLPLLGFSRKRRPSPGLDRLLRMAPWPMVVLGQVGLCIEMNGFKNEKRRGDEL